MYPSAARRTAARRRARLPQSGRLRHATFVSLLVGYKKVCEGGRRTARVEGVVVVQRTALVQHAHLVHRHLSHVGDERLEIEDSEAAVQIRIHQCAATHLTAWRDGRARGACECAIGCGLKVDCDVERAYMITCGIVVDQQDAKLVQATSLDRDETRNPLDIYNTCFSCTDLFVFTKSYCVCTVRRARCAPAMRPHTLQHHACDQREGAGASHTIGRGFIRATASKHEAAAAKK